MLSTLQFLTEELRNIDRSLNESLRYDYGGSRSFDFFTECKHRYVALVGTLEAFRNKTVDGQDDLQSLARQVSWLSELIARIERSRLGEYSRAFADALAKTATTACIGSPDPSPTSPLFFFSSNGGLHAYEVYRAQPPVGIGDRRIFNIVFPRTLKHHVLLHPILAHEIGHTFFTAMLRVRWVQFNGAVKKMFENSPFSDVGDLQKWLIKKFPDSDAAQRSTKQITITIQSWQEEFYCDMFGILMMGPAYMAAMRSLFSAVDVTGARYSYTHPPTLTRFSMLICALKQLGWDQAPAGASDRLQKLHSAFWNATTQGIGELSKWETVWDQGNVKAAVQMFESVFKDCNGVVYRQPDAATLEELATQIDQNIPPVGHQRYDEDSITLTTIDYRTIIYAGWLSACSSQMDNPLVEDNRFYEINRLCDQAILQQEAAARQLGWSAQ